VASKKRSSNRSFGPILVIVGVVGVAALGWVVSRPAKVVTLDSSLPAVAAAGIVKGSPDAPVEIVEFGDFECPACGYFAAVTEPDVMSRLVASGDVRFRFMDFPLSMHRNTVPAHNAAQCADEQGKFWEMHDLLFREQDRWNGEATRTPKKVFERLAGEAGLDVSTWSACYDSERKLPQIAANRREGERLRVGTTPSFIIGGQLITGALSYDQIRQYVSLEMARIANSQAAAAVKLPAAPTTPEKKAP